MKTVAVGYFGVPNVSVRCMIIQEALQYFKSRQWKDWRCTVQQNPQLKAVYIDEFEKQVSICPLFCNITDYERAAYKLQKAFDTFEDFLPTSKFGNPFLAPRSHQQETDKSDESDKNNVIDTFDNLSHIKKSWEEIYPDEVHVNKLVVPELPSEIIPESKIESMFLQMMTTPSSPLNDTLTSIHIIP